MRIRLEKDFEEKKHGKECTKEEGMVKIKRGRESALIFIKLKSCSCSEWKGRLQQRDRG